MISKKIGDLYESDSSVEENQNASFKDEKVYDLTKDNIEFIDVNEIQQEENAKIKLVKYLMENIFTNITYKYICDLRSALLTLNDKDILYLKENLYNTLAFLKEFVEKNNDNNNYYTIFQSTKELLISIINQENKLLENLWLKEDFLKIQVSYLDGVMKNIIDKQIRLKKSRKNLKSKLRLQRKLNEARDMVSELTKGESVDKK